MDQEYNARIADFYVNGAGTTGGVTVQQTGVTGQKFIVTTFDASSDAAGIVTVESPASTIIWRKRFTAAFNISKDFTHPVLKGASGKEVLIKLSASTTNCETSLGGYTVLG